MFNIFRRKSEQKTKKYGARKKKTLADVLEGAIIRQAQNDKEWALHLALQKEGLRIPEQEDKDIEKQKREIRKFVTAEALNKIKSDPELAGQFIEGQVEDILSDGKPSRRRSRDEEPGYYSMAGSSLSQALEELDSLAELKGKLAELGMVEGESSKGFFGGLQLKDLLAILPQVIPYLVGQKDASQQEPMYVVQVNGNPTQVAESQYKQLLQEGRIRPVAELAPPQERPKEQSEQVVTQQVEAKDQQEGPQVELPPLDFILEHITYEDMTSCMSNDPDEFVLILQELKGDDSEWAQFFWGLLSTSTYESLMSLAQHYSGDEKAAEYIEFLQTESSKAWIEFVINRIKETG